VQRQVLGGGSKRKHGLTFKHSAFARGLSGCAKS
jgi:hypothetical protein